MHESIEQLAKEPDKLEELPGIGERMVEHIQEIIATGDYSLRQKLLKKFPVTLLDILNLQSLGPKKVAFLWSNFKAATVADVEKLAREGKLRDLPGFGEKSEQNILKAVETHKRSTGRFRLDTAEAAAATIIAHIEKYPKGSCFGHPGGIAAPWPRNRRRSRPAADLGRRLHISKAHRRHRRSHPEISPHRSGSGARREQGQLYPRQRPPGGRASPRQGKLRRRTPLFHRFQGAQRRPAWPRQRHGLYAERICPGDAEGRTPRRRSHRSRKSTPSSSSTTSRPNFARTPARSPPPSSTSYPN